MEKKIVNVSIQGCDDSTEFDIEMTDSEFEFMEKVAKMASEVSTYGCMPVIVLAPAAPNPQTPNNE